MISLFSALGAAVLIGGAGVSMSSISVAPSNGTTSLDRSFSKLKQTPYYRTIMSQLVDSSNSNRFNQLVDSNGSVGFTKWCYWRGDKGHSQDVPFTYKVTGQDGKVYDALLAMTYQGHKVPINFDTYTGADFVQHKDWNAERTVKIILDPPQGGPGSVLHHESYLKTTWENFPLLNYHFSNSDALMLYDVKEHIVPKEINLEYLESKLKRFEDNTTIDISEAIKQIKAEDPYGWAKYVEDGLAGTGGIVGVITGLIGGAVAGAIGALASVLFSIVSIALNHINGNNAPNYNPAGQANEMWYYIKHFLFGYEGTTPFGKTIVAKKQALSWKRAYSPGNGFDSIKANGDDWTYREPVGPRDIYQSMANITDGFKDGISYACYRFGITSESSGTNKEFDTHRTDTFFLDNDGRFTNDTYTTKLQAWRYDGSNEDWNHVGDNQVHESYYPNGFDYRLNYRYYWNFI